MSIENSTSLLEKEFARQRKTKKWLESIIDRKNCISSMLKWIDDDVIKQVLDIFESTIKWYEKIVDNSIVAENVVPLAKELQDLKNSGAKKTRGEILKSTSRKYWEAV